MYTVFGVFENTPQAQALISELNNSMSTTLRIRRRRWARFIRTRPLR